MSNIITNKERKKEITKTKRGKMIKLLFLIIVFIALLFIKLLSSIVGIAGVTIDKRDTFLNYATQYLKNTKISYVILKPVLPDLVDEVFEISKNRHFNLSDETEFLEHTLFELICHIDANEKQLVPYRQVLPQIAILAASFAEEFRNKHNMNF